MVYLANPLSTKLKICKSTMEKTGKKKVLEEQKKILDEQIDYRRA